MSEATPLSSLGYGALPAVACTADRRFCFWSYVPRAAFDGGRRPPVLVAVHGSDRRAESLRDQFAPLAERAGAVVVAPLFPLGADDGDRDDGYKYPGVGNARHDRVLLAMLDDLQRRYPVACDRIVLFGFSGGAHFAHRFMFLHPERVRSVSICAPGSVTLPGHPQPWWVGTGDYEARFGRPFPIDALRRVSVHLAVGEDDLSTGLITHTPQSPTWMPGANAAGRTRVDRLHALREALRELGFDPHFETLPGVGHDERAHVINASRFLEPFLDGADAVPSDPPSCTGPTQ
ncbi:putative hydrolase [Ameyamaea chiangmaiensis NBRC 103196]|uniref:Alpha/beta hydrolase n=1 Tax=Ameyamaea chiangmaiensis TaxID=442969 RepID=A0A850PA42_9PROT|nr:alpha/beta hydrolase-fold protein [Ameyamaea chiangmaiensis]MBS4075736.1 alpha/beta hydrolase [Ameyamaea chiangmaiensis]NVN40808.1 alpha/beta hydrolase [Ameyamaea chiangmaiensis]GBQ70342.1 putative hydrolase [Ameyamaea chiangmaiensis NBRC 103196]